MTDDLVQACPECDQSSLRRRKPEHPQSDAPTRWYCYECQTHVEAPNERERRSSSGVPGLAGRLLNDVSAEEIP